MDAAASARDATQPAGPQAVDVSASLEAARRSLDLFCADPGIADELAAEACVMADAIGRGAKLLACGNGGSMAQAMHFAEELSGRFRKDRAPLPAIACTDPGHITCTANDYGFDAVFERWVAAVGRGGDVLVCFSTSGSSSNLLRAADTASRLGIRLIGILGHDGGPLLERCDRVFVAPGDTSDRIQEVHTVVMHALIEGIEQRLGLA